MSGDLSLRASISIVAAAAVLATAFVVLTWPDGDDDSSGLTADQGAAATSSTATPSPTPTPTSTPVPGADLEFPKIAGDWALNSVDLKEDVEGTFGGFGVIAYMGKAMATGTFTLVVYSGGRPVATLRAATSRANPKTSTTVSWVSSDPWVEHCDGYTFSAA